MADIPTLLDVRATVLKYSANFQKALMEEGPISKSDRQEYVRMVSTVLEGVIEIIDSKITVESQKENK